MKILLIYPLYPDSFWGFKHALKLLLWTLLKRPALFTEAITCAVDGYHFRTIYGLRQKLYNV